MSIILAILSGWNVATPKSGQVLWMASHWYWKKCLIWKYIQMPIYFLKTHASMMCIQKTIISILMSAQKKSKHCWQIVLPNAMRHSLRKSKKKSVTAIMKSRKRDRSWRMPSRNWKTPELKLKKGLKTTKKDLLSWSRKK